MSIYHTVDDHLDGYIESLGGNRSTLDDAMRWVSREMYHHDESIRLLGAITMHTLALDRDALAQEQGGNMTTKNTGGPAFPLLNNKIGYHADIRQEWYGVTVRDYFAAKAMQGLIAGCNAKLAIGPGIPNDNKRISIVAFSMADAMLAARENKS